MLQRMRNVAADARVSAAARSVRRRLGSAVVGAHRGERVCRDRTRAGRASADRHRAARQISPVRGGRRVFRCADAAEFPAGAAHRVVVPAGRMGVAVAASSRRFTPRIRDGVHLWQYAQKRRAAAMVALDELLRDSFTRRAIERSATVSSIDSDADLLLDLNRALRNPLMSLEIGPNRQRRIAEAERLLKSVAKQLAQRAGDSADDRRSREVIRVRVYNTLGARSCSNCAPPTTAPSRSRGARCSPASRFV